LPDPLFEHEDAANTPLTVEKREQLIPSYIALRHELNEAEQVNIGAAQRWADGHKVDVLDRRQSRSQTVTAICPLLRAHL
jgi:hypothetical protein